MKEFISTNRAFVDVPILRESGGRWLVIGFFRIRSKVWVDYSALILSFFRSCTIKGANLLYVLGILVEGWTYIICFSIVLMSILRRPDLLSGLSSKVRRHWWVISGLNYTGSLWSLDWIMWECSSELSRTSLLPTLSILSPAFSSMIMTLRWSLMSSGSRCTYLTRLKVGGFY